jgi:uncharacterized protein (TIGR02302 family)
VSLPKDQANRHTEVPGIAWRLRLARLVLFWERLWPALWPAVAVAGVFLVVALFDVLPMLPGPAHVTVLVLFIVAFAAALWRAVRAMSWPGASLGERRIEIASGLGDRPLMAIRDTLATSTGDSGSEALWRTHRKRMRARLRALRVGAPHPGLARYDTWALRGALLVVLVVALVAAGGDGFERLARAAKPQWSPAGASETATLELWITPPAYTGVAPIFLDRRTPADNALSIPTESAVLARLHGSGRPPTLVVGDTETAFTPLDSESFQAESTIAEDGHLAVRRSGRDLAGWDLSVIPDKAPIVVFALPPGASQRSHLRLSFFARDDYGIEAVHGTIRRVDDEGNVLEDEGKIDLDLPLPGLSQTEVETTTYHDLTPHPWAGLPVTIQLQAQDAIGQIGTSDSIQTVLPARVFQHPVARAIIEQRKKLSIDAGGESRRTVAYALRKLASQPAHFYDDKVVFLALVTASSRLVLSDDESGIPQIQDLLWNTALRIEDGELSLAERDLRAAQEALMQALAEDASDAEIEELMDSLRSALDRYLQALAENMSDNPTAVGDQVPLDPSAMMLEGNDLRDLLEQARQLAKSGAREAAKDLLAQFQEILENMQPMMQKFGKSGEGSLNEMLRNLGDLIHRQQDLLDQTYKQYQQGGQETRQGQQGQTSQGAATQDELRHHLGELMRRFGEQYGDIPQELGDAERAMRKSQEALERSLPGRAIGPQGEALDKLREGGRVMARGQQGIAEGPNGDDNGFQRDPLGRPMPGFGRANTDNVDIPDMSDFQRTREILDELRRRAGERERPQDELEYIDRLLRRF